MTTLPRYAELRALSNFSFLKGASHPEELVVRAIELGYAALAITDECSLAGVVRAHTEAKDSGLKLIIGSSFVLEDGLELVLLATNLNGYGNLSELITLGRMRCEKGRYRLTRADFDGSPQSPDEIPDAAGTIDHLAGVPDCIVLWIPSREAGDAALEADARWFASTFGNGVPPVSQSASESVSQPAFEPGPQSGSLASRVWIAVERTHRMDDKRVIQRLAALGERMELPCVATGNVHMHVRSRKPMQDTLTAIRLGRSVGDCGEALAPNAERHLRSRQRLSGLFAAPMLDATMTIVDRCDFSLKELGYQYPKEIVPDGETQTSYLRRLTDEGLEKRFPANVVAGLPEGRMDKVMHQVEHELALIADLRYEAFFLTVHDIVRYARSVGILCQGRGSAANSAVCYCLGITEVNPALQDMLFERFLTKERNEPPDIDVDFEHQRREEVIQYIYDKYGRHRTALAATVIAYRTRSAIRDVGKALGLDGERVNRLSASHAWWDGSAEHRDRLEENGFDPDSPIVQKMIELTGTLRSFPRHLSQHVGGFVISADKLSRMVPIENAAMQAPSDWDEATGRRRTYAGITGTDDVDGTHDAIGSEEAYEAAVDGDREASNGVDASGAEGSSDVHDVDVHRSAGTAIEDGRVLNSAHVHPFIEAGTRGDSRENGAHGTADALETDARWASGDRVAPRNIIEARSTSVRERDATCTSAGTVNDLATESRRTVVETTGDRHDGIDLPKRFGRDGSMHEAANDAIGAVASGVVGDDGRIEPDESDPHASGRPLRSKTRLFATFRSVIQWDKDDLEELGLLKVDVLALGMLSAVRRALDLVGRRHGRGPDNPFRMIDVPQEDPATYDMICEADTVGVFQIESRAQMSMLPRLRPRTYYDLVVEVAIVRPGPIVGGMVHPYLKAREAQRRGEQIEYIKPAVEEALKRTLGVPIFQEQVMQLMMLAADFSAGEADKLRRAMAAWKRKGGLGPFHDRIVNGMVKNDYPREYAEQIFKQVEGFGEYGFPESHAASFAFLVYISCWIKCHEPAAFLAAMLNSQPLGFYSSSQLIQDARRHDIEVRPIDVTISGWDAVLEEKDDQAGRRDETTSQFGTSTSTKATRRAKSDDSSPARYKADHEGRYEEDHEVNRIVDVSHGAGKSGIEPPRADRPQPAVRLGFNSILSFNQKASIRLTTARATRPFSSVEDMGRRAALSTIELDALAAAGALTGLVSHRREARWEAASHRLDADLMRSTAIQENPVSLRTATEGREIVDDYASTGFTLRRHPLALLRPKFKIMGLLSAAELQNVPDGKFVRTTGIVTVRQRPGTAKGTMFVSLEDEAGQINVIIWPHVVNNYRAPILSANLMTVFGIWQVHGIIKNIVASQLLDHSHLIKMLPTTSRDFH